MPASIAGLLEDNLRERPGETALTADGVTWSWSALGARARQIARALVGSGVQPQERIVYVGKNSAELLQVLLGAALANVIFVPLNWRLAPAELVQSIRDSRASVLVVDAELAEVAAGFRAELPAVRTPICTGSSPTAPGFASLESWAGDRPTTPFLVPAGERDLAVQMYTSGTTGRPKGAMFAGGTNLRVLMEDVSRAWDLRAGDVSLLCMPLFHSGRARLGSHRDGPRRQARRGPRLRADRGARPVRAGTGHHRLRPGDGAGAPRRARSRAPRAHLSAAGVLRLADRAGHPAAFSRSTG